MFKVRRRQVSDTVHRVNGNSEVHDKQTDDRNSFLSTVSTFSLNCWNNLFDSRICGPAFLVVIWLCSVAISVMVVRKVPYTEIDWKTYMQQVEIFLNGTLDYYQLKGDTGPLVYPAGFLYVYSLLYKLTENGTNIFKGQCIFVTIYACFLAVVYRIYNRRVAPYTVLLVTFTAYRITSIFILRMFNDTIAMLFYYTSILFMMKNYWSLGAIFYSLGVAIKMNILLSAPGLFVFLIATRSVLNVAKFLIICALVQVSLGFPFLLTNYLHYIEKSFELKRVFNYTWTVNWKFLPEELFLHRYFHVSLLLSHIVVILIVVVLRWSQLRYIFGSSKTKKLSTARSKKNALIDVLIESNFIGIVFCRSLHYQFYVWYYHSLPLLLRSKNDRSREYTGILLRVAIMIVLEFCWNVYPANAISSVVITVCHLLILMLTFIRDFAE
ncbi:hypothetical protein GJ496_007475 [Pomphorhynchus laevis]|nr:hypothetical protein GJ496_007475 [Pomphorhynchus laevis]